MPKEEAIIKLGDWMREDANRKKFKDNPAQAIGDLGLTIDDIGKNLYNALKKLSVDQLAKMSNVGAALREDGASGPAALRMV